MRRDSRVLIWINLGRMRTLLSFFCRLEVTMAETPKLSVEKALQKMRRADATKSGSERHAEELDALEAEIKRLRAQRLRLDRHQRRSTEGD